MAHHIGSHFVWKMLFTLFCISVVGNVFFKSGIRSISFETTIEILKKNDYKVITTIFFKVIDYIRLLFLPVIRITYDCFRLQYYYSVILLNVMFLKKKLHFDIIIYNLFLIIHYQNSWVTYSFIAFLYTLC